MNTKERIFETALELFSENGFNATSIRMITKKVGITVASFYNHFKSKEELLQKVYDYYREQDIDSNYEQLLDELGPIGLMNFIKDVHVKYAENERLAKLTKIIVMEQYTNKTAAEISFKDRQKLLKSTEELFVLMSKKGFIKVNDSWLIGQLIGYAYLGFAYHNPYYNSLEEKKPEDIATEQLDLITRFVKALIDQ